MSETGALLPNIGILLWTDKYIVQDEYDKWYSYQKVNWCQKSIIIKISGVKSY